MAFLADKYQELKKQLDTANVNLVAVSKTKSKEDIMEAYENGIRDFGENYVQELVDKYESLPKDIRWHFIGHLQSNKIKYIAPFVHLIHGVDSEKLLMEINRQGAKINRVIDCLMQVHISKEETKFGFDEMELTGVVSKITSGKKMFSHVSIKGLMGMATFTEDNALIVSEFKNLKNIFEKLKLQFPILNENLSIISMGMSADYMLAIEAGSTMVRIGSLLFGERNYG